MSQQPSESSIIISCKAASVMSRRVAKDPSDGGYADVGCHAGMVSLRLTPEQFATFPEPGATIAFQCLASIHPKFGYQIASVIGFKVVGGETKAAA